nr:hypothetical protein [Pseudomonas sp.]
MSFDSEPEISAILNRIVSIWDVERRVETPIDIGKGNHAYSSELAQRLEQELRVRFPDSVVSSHVEESGRIIFSKNPI